MKAQTFRYRSLLSEQNQNLWFGPLIIGTKAERFNLFQNYLKSNWNVLAFFKVQKRNQNETELISYRIETFPYNYASKETKRNFCELFPNFFTSSERFCLLQLLRNQKRTFVFSKNDIKTKPKRYKLRQGFLKTKQNFLLFHKKFGNGPEQKLVY